MRRPLPESQPEEIEIFTLEELDDLIDGNIPELEFAAFRCLGVKIGHA